MSLSFDLSDLFRITTKEEKKERERAFFKRVFPLGEEQKEKVISFLKGTIVNKKQDETVCLFSYISLYDALTTEETGKRNRKFNIWKKSIFIKEEDKLTVYALVLLNQELETLEDFPDEKEVAVRAEKLRVELSG
ncbi:MAG: hypothetical protein GX222_00725 [Ruminococcaceae bacterium]|nr:hypothetical protein [Oscillospiraceae bacterium]